MQLSEYVLNVQAGRAEEGLVEQAGYQNTGPDRYRTAG